MSTKLVIPAGCLPPARTLITNFCTIIVFRARYVRPILDQVPHTRWTEAILGFSTALFFLYYLMFSISIPRGSCCSVEARMCMHLVYIAYVGMYHRSIAHSDHSGHSDQSGHPDHSDHSDHSGRSDHSDQSDVSDHSDHSALSDH